MMSKDRVFEDLRSLGEFLQQRVPPEASARVAAVAVGRRHPRRSRRWVVVIVTAALLAVSNTALARASDAAIPGDLFYPFDRAYEWVGDRFGSQDRVPERAQEALQLADKGDNDGALTLVREILAAGAGQENLQVAIGQLTGSGNSQAVRDQVKDLVAAAQLVHEAAQSGNHEALADAIAAVKQQASEVAETASDGRAGGNNQDTPSVTGPGQVDNPSNTAPGQIESPSATAPGEIKNPGTTSPSDTAPGQAKKSDKPDSGGSNDNSNDPPQPRPRSGQFAALTKG